MRDAAECGSKFLRGLADQVSFADARKIFGKARDAAELRLSARDPENVGKRRQGACGCICIGALGIVDEQHVAATADLLHAVRKAGKTSQSFLQDLTGNPE